MKQRNRQFFSLAMVMTLVALMLGACGDATNTSGPASATTAAGGAAATTAATSATTAAAGAATTAATTAAGGAATTAAATTAAGGAATTAAATTAAGGAATTAAGGAATTAAGAGSGSATGAALKLPANCTSVQLQYWNPFTGPDGPFMGNMVNKFNQANPNIKVTMTTQAEYYIQLGTAAASDALPDVAIIHADQVATQAYRNVLRPIDDLAKQIGANSGDFPGPVWKAGEVAGKRYTIPLDIHPAVLYYNEDLLKKGNVSAAPKTNEDFQKAAQAMTSGGSKGYMISTGFFSRQIFEMLLNQYGGSAFNTDGSKSTWNSDAGVKALQWMKDAQSKYSEPKLETDAELNAFKAGTAGMVINGIWQVSNLTGKAVSFGGKGTAVPQIGTQAAVWAGSHQLALPTHKRGNDACKDAASAMLVKYLVDNSLEWAKGGQIPASNTVRNSAEFKAIEPQASIAPSVEKAFFPPSVPGITDAYVPLDEAVGAIMSGTASDIKATLDDAAKRADQILTENKTKFGSAPK